MAKSAYNIRNQLFQHTVRGAFGRNLSWESRSLPYNYHSQGKCNSQTEVAQWTAYLRSRWKTKLRLRCNSDRKSLDWANSGRGIMGSYCAERKLRNVFRCKSCQSRPTEFPAMRGNKGWLGSGEDPHLVQHTKRTYMPPWKPSWKWLPWKPSWNWQR